MSAASTGLDRWTRRWLVASIVLGAALELAAFTVPVYTGGPSRTLVGVNGDTVALIVAVPLVGALAASGLIVARRRRGRGGVGVLTWLVIAALGLFAVVGLLTIGLFVLPVPVCLVVAALRVVEAPSPSNPPH